MAYPLHTHILRAIGALLILIGGIAAYYGPMEWNCFYFFSENGRFAYEGFGFGSLWFAALVCHNLAYYVLAAICLPLGIGTWRLRRWALTLSRLALWCWIGIGGMMCIALAYTLPGIFKSDLPRQVILTRVGIVGVFMLIVGVGLPALLLRWYASRRVKATFEQHDSRRYWTERTPFMVLVLLCACLGMLAWLHFVILLQGFLPLFGKILFGRTAINLIAGCVAILVFLMYGLAHRQSWAWWGACAYFLFFIISAVITYPQGRIADIYPLMQLPPGEMEFLAQAAWLQEVNLVGLLLLLVALGLLMAVRRNYKDFT
jgi:uncharacterized membrane protein YidH (DUF202 family)